MSTGGLGFSPEVSDEDLCNKFIFSVAQPSFGLLKITEMKFKLQEHLREKDLIWTERGVLSKTGVRTIDGKYYSGGECRPEKYGYRLGDEQLASDLKLTSTPTRIKSRVTPGSQKTLHVLTLSSSASPFRFATISKTTTTTTTTILIAPSSSSTTTPSSSSSSQKHSTNGITSVPSASSSSLVPTGSANYVDIAEMEALKKRVAYLETTLQQVLGVVIKLQSQVDKMKS